MLKCAALMTYQAQRVLWIIRITEFSLQRKQTSLECLRFSPWNWWNTFTAVVMAVTEEA
jgi:hypothetical protein